MSTLIILVMIAASWVPVAEIPVESCAIGGQVAAAQWQQLHPEHKGRPIKLRCERGQQT